MQNSMVVFAFSVLDREYLFWANLVSKNLKSLFKVRFDTYTNSNMQNSMMLTFSVLDRKYPFLANLVANFKIVFMWDLTPRLIQICRIPWWCWLFLFSTGNIVFGQIWSKSKVLQKFRVHGFSNPEKKIRVKFCSGMSKT